MRTDKLKLELHTRKRICPVNGCRVEIKNSLLMCGEHWGMCPKELKAEVWRWFTAMRTTCSAVALYKEAAAKAIASVNETEKVVQETARQQILL